MRRPSPRVAIAFALAAGFVVFGVVSSPRYGITIDSPALFYAGDRMLCWAEHPRTPRALDLDTDDPPGFHSHFGRYPAWSDPFHYPALPGFVAALTSQIAHDRLGWGTVLDGHQLGLILLHGLALFLYCLLATELLGFGAGIAATLALALFPCILGHAFNNAKDLPCADFYALAVLAAGIGWLRERPRMLLAAGLFAGLSLSCKMNGIFAILTVALWLPVPLLLRLRNREPPVSPRLAASALAIPYLAGAVFLLLWPWLTHSGLTAFWTRLDWYVKFMADFARGERPGWTSYPLRALVFTTPPLILAAAAIYLVIGLRAVVPKGSEPLGLWSLLVLWLGLPLFRIAAPHSNFYDANRHFIEYVPALCAMAGAGAAQATRWLGQRARERGGPPARFFRPALLVAALLALWSLVRADARYHPFETTYFNALAGGLGRAQHKGLYTVPPPHDGRTVATEGDFWFNSLRAGLQDALTLVPAGQSLGLCGPYGDQARGDLVGPPPFTIRDGRGMETADFVYASPRAGDCEWSTVRRLEAERPILRRVEREGGLIYEILGPRAPSPNVQGPERKLSRST